MKNCPHGGNLCNTSFIITPGVLMNTGGRKFLLLGQLHRLVTFRPMSLYCGICSFPYNRILHFENIETEEKYFAKEISAKNAIHPRWENRNDEGFPKEEILRKYFDILEDAEIDALYKIYKDDFKMFGYQFKYKHFKLNVD